MNTTTIRTRRTSQSARRAVPALAIVVLAIGLGACQTPPRGGVVEEAPVVVKHQMQNRIEVEMERRAREAMLNRHLVADRLDTTVATKAAPKATTPQSPPADRLDEDYVDPTERVHVPGGGGSY